MHQEVRVREEGDFVERRDLVGPGPQGGSMAGGAADPQEYRFTSLALRESGRRGGGARKVVWSASCITVAVVSLGLVSAGLAASRAAFPPGGFSCGKNGVVMPISLRKALPLKVRTVPIWHFQPNRPTRG